MKNSENAETLVLNMNMNNTFKKSKDTLKTIISEWTFMWLFLVTQDSLWVDDRVAKTLDPRRY